jgi:hypothetical protein
MTSLRVRRPGQRRQATRGSATRGQSLVEFALVTPILVVLILAIADFGRIFATGVLIEAAARDGAEVAANDYLANPPGPLGSPSTGTSTYYDALHLLAARAVCAEMRELPNTTYSGGDCPTMPLVQVCVHDSVDMQCAVPPTGYAPMAPDCTDFPGPPTNSQQSSTERWVEVRVCYRFTTLLGVAPLPSEVWLQRSRMFAIPCYFALGTPNPCGT